MGEKMIIDYTGTVLIPGNMGMDCPGNGGHADVECCCGECDYMMCCLETHRADMRLICENRYCPNAKLSNRSDGGD